MRQIESGNPDHIVYGSGSPLSLACMFVCVFAEHLSVRSGSQAFFTRIVRSPFSAIWTFLCVLQLTQGKVSFG